MTDKGTRTACVAQTPKPSPWKKSKAKELLKTDIIDGTVTDAMAPILVYAMRLEYKPYKLDNFRTNLRSLQKKIHTDYGRRDRDCMDYGHDRFIYDELRRQAVADNGGIEVVPWHLSDAQSLLKDDITGGLLKVLKPSELWETREEYKEFSLKVFRNHIYQEVDRREKRRMNFKKKSGKTRKAIKDAVQRAQGQNTNNEDN
eukprot:scaffold44014_cov56-Attheya_sp.AAC.4